MGTDHPRLNTISSALKMAYGTVLHQRFPILSRNLCVVAARHEHTALVPSRWDIQGRVGCEEVGGTKVDLLGFNRPISC